MPTNNCCAAAEQKIARLEATISRLRKENEKLQLEANIDALTGIANRKYIGEQLSVAIRNLYNLQNDTVTVLFLDVDLFKKLNDTRGHCVGDEVLKEVGRILCSPALSVYAMGLGRRKLVSDDIYKEKRRLKAGRWGGEEFLVVAVNLKDPQALAEVIRKKVREIRIPGHDDLQVTISIGVAHTKVHTVTKEELLRKADAAMYEAKKKGRDCVVMAEMPEPDTRQILVV